jgi:hypothetical protein
MYQKGQGRGGVRLREARDPDHERPIRQGIHGLITSRAICAQHVTGAAEGKCRLLHHDRGHNVLRFVLISVRCTEHRVLWPTSMPRSRIFDSSRLVSAYMRATTTRWATAVRRLKQALDQLTTLPYLALLQLLPAIHSSDLDADHGLVAIVGREVAHGLCLLDPWIPSNCIPDVVTNDIEAGLSILEDGGCILRDRLVDAVDFASDLESVVLLLVRSRVENLVDVLSTRQACNADLGNVL